MLIRKPIILHFFLASAVLFVITPQITFGQESQNHTGFVEAVRQAPSRMVSWPQNYRTRQLLSRFKPKVYVSPKSYLPISFYRDYLPNTVLKNRKGEVVKKPATRSVLKTYSIDNNYYLDYQVSASKSLKLRPNEIEPTLYGRIYADTLTYKSRSIPLLFLKYSAVFPYSGLPYANSWWKNLGSNLAGDPWAWHELDIHGAIHVILHAPTRKPLGVLLAQHNYHETLLRSIDFSWPPNDRLKIAYAVRSNEPYLITNERATRIEPTVAKPFDIPALFGRTWIRPLSAGYDKIVAPTDGALRIQTQLKLLPLTDPLYTSQMNLGDIRGLFGIWPIWYREGPPGMNYYAHPDLKELSKLSAFWYINPRDDEFFELIQKMKQNPWQSMNFHPVLHHQKERFWNVLRSKLPSPKN